MFGSATAPALPLGALVATYLAFHVKHFVCDFFLQTGAMAAGKSGISNWARPLAVHAGIHGIGTAAIVLVAAPALWWLAPVDMAVHAFLDRAKALATRRLTPDKNPYWWLFGADQEMHHITHFVYVLLMLTL